MSNTSSIVGFLFGNFRSYWRFDFAFHNRYNSLWEKKTGAKLGAECRGGEGA